MSDTPRTDTAYEHAKLNITEAIQTHNEIHMVDVTFARDLEKEVNRLYDAADKVYRRLNELGCFTDEQEILRSTLVTIKRNVD